jgi:hypothetical protein
MEDRSVLEHIENLVHQEKVLWNLRDRDEYQTERLEEIKVELDQCWDLLRQRRAKREMGEDPDAASLRDPEVVESYVG